MPSQTSFLDGLTERNRILAEMAQDHRIYLTALRSFARVIAMRKGDVSIDDVRDHMDAVGYPFPHEIGADDRILGSLFATKEFYAIRQVPTRRREWAKRVGRARSFITVYGLRTS